MTMTLRVVTGVLVLGFGVGAIAQAPTDAPSPPRSPVSLRIKAPEAHQGAASDGTYVYAIDNDRIGK